MSKNAKILLDVAEENPIKDFEIYVNAASAIIKNTEARFSIGVYGEWGTGKTTMMKGIENKLQDSENIITVWFDAWRYENEEHHAAIPLLKQIAYSIEHDENFKHIAEKIKTSAGILTKNIISGIISKYVSELDIKKIKKEFKEKMSILTGFEKDTIYYEGLNAISSEMQKDSRKKIVIFIDDLDRCSPEKTIQVLESTKAFLDIPGFVFVFGLSHDTTARRIEEKYKGSNISGEDYIKKIIQVPFNIQTWNKDDTIDLIKNMATKLEPYYKNIIEKEPITKKLIIALEKNPREIKRFLNAFIISNEVYFGNKEFESLRFLSVFALKWRWPKTYALIGRDSRFQEELKQVTKMSYVQRNNTFQKNNDNNDENIQKNTFEFLNEIRELLDDHDFWEFIDKENLIFTITDWEPYRRASFVTKESFETIQIQNEHSEELIKLLKYSVQNFNKLRKEKDLENIDLQNADFGGVNLTGADLRDANLTGADLRDANLTGAELVGTNFNGVINLPMSSQQAKKLGAINVDKN